MDLVIGTGGQVRCIYDEAIDLAALGELNIKRASYVEPEEHGMWFVTFSSFDGLRLGPYTNRSQALAAEHAWLNANWLKRATDQLACRPRDTDRHVQDHECGGHSVAAVVPAILTA